MNAIGKFLLAGIAAAALCCAGSTRADSSASAILSVSNFRLLHDDGTAYTVTDFDTVYVSSPSAVAGATLGGTSGSALGSADLINQCVGGACPFMPENDFTTIPVPTPNGQFARGDQLTTGNIIEVENMAAGADMHKRADFSTLGGEHADVRVFDLRYMNFSLMPGSDGVVRLDFDYSVYLDAYTSAGSPESAWSRVEWEVLIRSDNSGVHVFSLEPSELNAFFRSGAPGVPPYSASGSMSGSAFLQPGSLYTLEIRGMTTVGVVPEPGMTAMLLAGLLATAAARWRRR